MHHRLSQGADRDIEHILDETLRDFGTNQVQVYSALIDRAIAMVADKPDRPPAKVRADLGEGVRSFHVATASGRRGGASHVIYFTVADGPAGDQELLVIRVLHDRMEPRLKLVIRSEDHDETAAAQAQLATPDEEENLFSP